MQHVSVVSFLGLLSLAAAATPFDDYILAPSSRLLFPVSVYNTSGTVTDQGTVLNGATDGSLTLTDEGSSVSYDFGKNIAGWVSVFVTETEGEHNLTVGFSESSTYVSYDRGDTSASVCDVSRALLRNFSDSLQPDVLSFAVNTAGNYTASFEYQRGGFRYLTLSLRDAGTIKISNVTVNYAAIPGPDEGMRNYTGYFHSSDEQLNRLVS